MIETGQVDGPTTEVPGSRVETPGTRFGTGTPTYSGLTILGDPYRVGGSVNMFGLQGAKNKNWPGSEYDFTADYSTTTTVSYNCEVSQVTETYHPAVFIPGRKVQGYSINCDFGHGQGNDNSGTCEDAGQPQGSCLAHNNTGDSLPFWGEDTEQCKFIKTGDAVEEVNEPEYWTNNPPIVRVDLGTSHTVDETNIAEDVAGHEVNGGPWTEVAAPGTLWNAGQVVICISPSKTVKGGVPGAWANHNGYTGSKCTTAWFKVAPWGAGTSTSNGTLISATTSSVRGSCCACAVGARAAGAKATGRTASCGLGTGAAMPLSVLVTSSALAGIGGAAARGVAARAGWAGAVTKGWLKLASAASARAETEAGRDGSLAASLATPLSLVTLAGSRSG